MFSTTIKVAIRNLARHKLLSIINISGLAVGLSSAILIVMWVNHELSYDKFHENADHIYQVMSDENIEGKQIIGNTSVYPLGDVLKGNYPQFENVVRTIIDEDKNISIIHQNEAFKDIITYTDPEFFEMFSFKLLKGNRTKLFSTPNHAVITEELALRIFNERDVIGKELKLKSFDFNEIVTISGVIENPPSNSSIKYGVILPMKLILSKWEWLNNWGTRFLNTYIQVIDGQNIAELENQIKDIPSQYHTWKYNLFLHPLQDLHLYNDFSNGRSASGNIIYVRILSLTALVILLIAVINFVNLTTAYSTKRAREIGVRKVLGASPGSVIRNHLLENIIIALAASIIAFIIVQLISPVFNSITDKSLDLINQSAAFFILIFLGAVLTGIISSIYPALILSRLRPTLVLYKRLKFNFNISWWGKGLMIFQLIVAIIMIFAAVTISEQLSYMQNKPLGLKKENVLYFLYQEEIYNQQGVVKNELQQIPEVKSVSYISSNPLYVYSSSGDPTWPGKQPKQNTQFYFIDAGYDVSETLGLEIIEGRTFSKEISSDTSSFLINKAAANIIGLDNPIGLEMEFWDKKGKIVGIFNDFQHKGFKEEIGPMIIRFWPENSLYCYVKFDGNAKEVVKKIKNVYHQFEPQYGFDYHFLDDDFEKLYKSEQSVGKLSSIFSVIAVFISSVGLFGLVAFITERRIREVAIRKVLGATLQEIWNTLARPFMIWSLIAISVAIPMGTYLMKGWLNNFAYRTELSFITFLFTFSIFTTIILLTISWKIINTARINPVETLKIE